MGKLPGKKSTLTDIKPKSLSSDFAALSELSSNVLENEDQIISFKTDKTDPEPPKEEKKIDEVRSDVKEEPMKPSMAEEKPLPGIAVEASSKVEKKTAPPQKINSPILSNTELPVIKNTGYLENLRKGKDNKERDALGFATARISQVTANEIDYLIFVLKHQYNIKSDIKTIIEQGITEVKNQLGI